MASNSIPITSINVDQQNNTLQNEKSTLECDIRKLVRVASFVLALVLLVFAIVKISLILAGLGTPQALSQIDQVSKVVDQLNSALLVLQPTSSESEFVVIRLNHTIEEKDKLLKLIAQRLKEVKHE